MCGIAGIVAPDAASSIERMTRVLAHRGPDGEGYFHDQGIALGHRRLSIIDLEGGAQPIANEDESVHLICNGEIYNSPVLREQLIEKGHSFRTKTDVEVILHLYEEHGRDCVKFLRGMFAFAIWDKPRRRLLLARDHMGQKPLFFWNEGSEVLFASEIKGILASDRVTRNVDLAGLWHYVSLRYLPDQCTLFKGIHKLSAATTAQFENGNVSIEKYWDPSFREKHQDGLSATVDRLDTILTETVRSHLLSDVRIGAFLSGGIDSSTIAAIMASSIDEPIPAFSIGVEEQGFDELPYARLVAEQYKMESHEQVVKADLIHLMPSMVYHMDEPSDPFAVGVFLVSQMAAKHVKVVLTGDGGDENFAGYDRYLGQRLVDYYCLMPATVRKHVMSRLARLIPESYGYKSLALKAAWLNDMSFYGKGDRYARSLTFLRFTHEAKRELFTDEARNELGDNNSIDKVLEFFDAPNADSIVDKMLYTDLMTRMPDHLLAIVDRMSMAHSLETRAPMVDYEFVDHAAGIPAKWKLRRTDLKHVLKKVARKHLPGELIDRKKQGFTFPIGIWMRTDLHSFMRNLFRDSRFVSAGIFRQEYIEELLDQHMSGQADHNYRLWILMNLEFWYRINFEGQTLDSLREYTDQLMAA